MATTPAVSADMTILIGISLRKYIKSKVSVNIKKYQLKAYNKPNTAPAFSPVEKVVMFAQRVKITAKIKV